MTRYQVISLLAVAAVLLTVHPAQADHINPIPGNEHGDLWEHTNLTSVTSTGMKSITDVRNIFGTAIGSADGAAGWALFRDDRSAGFVHTAEWTSSSAQTIRSISMDALHDLTNDRIRRGFSEFRLFAWNSSTTTFDPIYSLTTGDPYATTIAPPGTKIDTTFLPNRGLRMFANVVPMTTDRWKAEFVQTFPTPSVHSGPRIIELNGFDTFHPDLPSVPEPSTVAFTALGLLGILGLRRSTK